MAAITTSRLPDTSHPIPIRHFIAIIFIGLITTAGFAQKNLYVALSNSKGYVVGAKLQQSGIFRYDQDSTWAHIGWNHPGIMGLAFADEANGTIHAAAGNGEMRSFDGGATWKITTGWDVTESQHIVLDRTDKNRVYLATAYGIWISQDEGDTWKQVHDDFTQALVSDVSSDRRVIAATEHGLLLTDNGGETWKLVGPEAAMIDVGQSQSRPLEWIAGSRTEGILRSSDGGLSWTPALALDSSAAGVSIDPNDFRRQAVVTWGDGIHVSQDGGESWSRRSGLPTAYLVETIFDANMTGRLWVATREEGIFYTDDLGATWAYAGFTGTMVYDMVFAP